MFVVVFGGFVLYFVVSMIRHGGIKDAMFGASIDDTLGEVELGSSRFSSQKIKVHVLGRRSLLEPAVGLELSMSSAGSWSMTPITLSSDEARRLISLLERAIAR